MISFTPLWRTLKEKNISTYKMEHQYGMSKAMINKLRHNESITLKTLDELCKMFGCTITDVIDYTEE